MHGGVPRVPLWWADEATAQMLGDCPSRELRKRLEAWGQEYTKNGLSDDWVGHAEWVARGRELAVQVRSENQTSGSTSSISRSNRTKVPTATGSRSPDSCRPPRQLPQLSQHRGGWGRQPRPPPRPRQVGDSKPPPTRHFVAGPAASATGVLGQWIDEGCSPGHVNATLWRCRIPFLVAQQRDAPLTADELAALQGVGPLSSVDDVRADLWKNDAEVDAFIEDVRRARQANVA